MPSTLSRDAFLSNLAILGKPWEFHNEELLYRLFGVNAQLLIDHAWGWESCTIADIRAYRPACNSISSGQVLQHPTGYAQTKLIVKEMADLLALDLVEKGLVTNQIVLTVGYDRENLTDNRIVYSGPVTVDHYGRKVPKHAHGTENLGNFTASTRQIVDGVMALFERIVNPQLLCRRINLTASRVVPEERVEAAAEQMDLFGNPISNRGWQEKERRRQQAVLGIRRKYGKNAILKGMNYQEGATTIQRNGQIGGHKA